MTFKGVAWRRPFRIHITPCNTIIVIYQKQLGVQESQLLVARETKPSPTSSVSCILIVQETGDFGISIGIENLNWLSPEVTCKVLTGSGSCSILTPETPGINWVYIPLFKKSSEWVTKSKGDRQQTICVCLCFTFYLYWRNGCSINHYSDILIKIILTK